MHKEYTALLCDCCGEETIEVHKHHVLPKTLGGIDCSTNLVNCCLTCHGKIHDHNFLNRRVLQKEGIKKAKAENPQKYKGRKPKYTHKQLVLIMNMFNSGDGVNKIARDVGLSKFSVSRITRDPDNALNTLNRWTT